MLKQFKRPTQLRRKLKSLGFGGVVTLLARRALTVAPGGEAFREFLVVLSQPQPAPKAVAAASSHTFRLATLEDLERLLQDPSSKIVERDIEAFKGGSICLLQLDGENLVGYTWASDSPLIDVGWGFHINLPDDVIYNYNGFTAPEYRGTAYQALRHQKLLEHARTMGKHRLMGYIDHLNFKSIRGGAKGGYQPVGILRGVRRKGKIHFSLTVCEEGWSFVTRSGPHHALIGGS